MEPQSNNLENAPKKSPESLPTPESGKKLEGVPIGALEHLGDDISHESDAGATKNGPQTSSTAVPIVAPTIQPITQDDTDSTTKPAPIVAADDDVIEKEWVNKAKTVIKQTKGDPYAKEREVTKLQADYMQKRYGKEVKIPDET